MSIEAIDGLSVPEVDVKDLDRVSYSSLVNYHNCGKFFELANIRKIAKRQNTPDTIYGTWIHKYCQMSALDQVGPQEASEKFEKIWLKFCKWYKVDEKYLSYSETGKRTVLSFKGFLNKNFLGYKAKHVEYKIISEISNHPQSFKGFIDLVLESPDGKIIICDLKSANSLYFFQENRDKIKDYQLTLYKKFYSELNNISLDNIETCFIVFEKIESSSYNTIHLIDVGSGSVKIKNAEEWMNNILTNINRSKFIKNRLHCRKYGEKYKCQFLGTKYCKNF